jgi:diadenosine tetraphosphatase ApaH/serine/threonine PP2A family protein phosphatase
MGEFDQVTLSDDDLAGWSRSAQHAARSILWCRSLLANNEIGGQLRAFLAQRPCLHREGATLYVHGTPRQPLNEFLFPCDIYNVEKMHRIGEAMDCLCFNGHTHVPGIFLEAGPDDWHFLSPSECEPVFAVENKRLICNVGSVGQPRDDDWRACYVLFDGSRIWFRRLDYDIDQTVGKIHPNPDLDNFLADRLREGR